MTEHCAGSLTCSTRACSGSVSPPSSSRLKRGKAAISLAAASGCSRSSSLNMATARLPPPPLVASASISVFAAWWVGSAASVAAASASGHLRNTSSTCADVFNLIKKRKKTIS
eukprot:1194840-Prorocentrum_minimum.AAC.2